MLNADWKSPRGISLRLLEQLETQLKEREYVETKVAGRSSRVILDARKKQELRDTVTTKLSFLHYLFNALSKPQESTPTEATEITPTYELILSLLDLPAIRRDFEKAYEIFSRRIYHPTFHHAIAPGVPFLLPDGFILTHGRFGKKDCLVSLDRETLTTYKDFLVATGKVVDPILRPTYSPEEEVFGPYFAFLRLGHNHVFGTSHVSRLLDKAFEEYESESYSNCISSIGLIAEDYLEQVYETLFREVCPKNLTLGQTSDAIHSRIKNAFEPPVRSNEPVEPLYQEITVQLERRKSDPSIDLTAEIYGLVRKLLTLIKSDRLYLVQQLDGMKKPQITLSCFPKALREHLTDLIRYRNAVSHKTRVPIGAYEALRSMFCLVNFVIWWHGEKDAIDWSEDQQTILKRIIERSTGVSVLPA